MEVGLDNTSLMTFSDAEIQESGAFLLSQLEKLDPRLYQPIYNNTIHRDIKFRTDVTELDTASSFQKVYFKDTKGANGGIPYYAPHTNTIPGVDVSAEKITHSFRIWARRIAYNLIDLRRSKMLNKPLDAMKMDALGLSHIMDLEKAVYIGDSTQGYTGLLNDPEAITAATALKVDWTAAATTADSIVQDINDMFMKAWERTKFNFLPTKMIMSPELYGLLVSKKVSEAGNVSVLNYVRENSIVKNTLGILPEIVSVRWLSSSLTAEGAVANRIIVYENREDFIRYPYSPLKRIGNVYQAGAEYHADYMAGFGELEIVYPETLNYFTVKTN